MAGSGRSLSDQELAEMRDRAFRVADNPNASGSARAVARDLIRVTTLLINARKGRTAARRRREVLEDLERLWGL